MKRRLFLATALVATATRAFGQSAPSAQQVLADAASDGRYTFLLFYKDNGPAAQAMAMTLKQTLANRDDATMAYVAANKPADLPLVEKFKVSRAPMPLVIAVAPNGAVTGLFPMKLTPAQVTGAFVTPKLAECIRHMQEGRLVFVCVSKDGAGEVPQGVHDFQSDPQFSGRSEIVSFASHDPAEGPFLKQLKIDPATLKQPTTAFLAPPAMLVGKFGPQATVQEIAGALHAAGKCCDDPNCKHNHNHGKQQARQPARATR